jgi:hypothetical protein
MRVVPSVATLACALIVAVTASAATAEVFLAASPSKVSPGAAIRVYGNAGSCPVGDTVFAISRLFPGHEFGRDGALLGHVLHGGSFLIRGHVRATARPGRYLITARCGGGSFGLPLPVRVVARRP